MMKTWCDDAAHSSRRVDVCRPGLSLQVTVHFEGLHTDARGPLRKLNRNDVELLAPPSESQQPQEAEQQSYFWLPDI